MRVLIEFLINRRITQAEIRAEVDDFQPAVQQGAGNLRSDAMRQCKEGDPGTGSRNGVRIRLDEGQLPARCLGESRENHIQGFPGLRA